MPLEGLEHSSPATSALDGVDFLTQFRNSLLQARQFAQHRSTRSFKSDAVELPLGDFEYKPELPMSQTPLDLFHKFKFDKLESPTIKRRRLSVDSYSHDEFANGPSRYQEVHSKEGEDQTQYGQAWLLRFVLLCTGMLMIASARSFARDFRRLMTPRI
jgi:hypothetical protein